MDGAKAGGQEEVLGPLDLYLPSHLYRVGTWEDATSRVTGWPRDSNTSGYGRKCVSFGQPS